MIKSSKLLHHLRITPSWLHNSFRGDVGHYNSENEWKNSTKYYKCIQWSHYPCPCETLLIIVHIDFIITKLKTCICLYIVPFYKLDCVGDVLVNWVCIVWYTWNVYTLTKNCQTWITKRHCPIGNCRSNTIAKLIKLYYRVNFFHFYFKLYSLFIF